MVTPLHIAIDGPVGSGKSAVSLQLSQELGIVYLYTGAMYRALALASLEQHVSLDNEEQVLGILEHSSITLNKADPNSQYFVKVVLNNTDVTDKIFSPEVDRTTPIVSAHKRVREEMVKRQQQLAQNTSVVMEGRDIGLRVLPHAQLKIYLIASLEVRSKRRFKQFQKKGIQKTLEEVIEDTKQRDLQDTMRAVDPLKKLPDAWELDTTHLSQDQVIAAIKQELSNRGLL